MQFPLLVLLKLNIDKILKVEQQMQRLYVVGSPADDRSKQGYSRATKGPCKHLDKIGFVPVPTHLLRGLEL